MNKQRKYLNRYNLYKKFIFFLKLLKKYFFSISNSLKYFFISKKRKSIFMEDYTKLKKMLLNDIHFGFSRFSDGELFIIENQKLEISTNEARLSGKLIGVTNYSIEETKLYDPNNHQFYRQQLINSLTFKKKNYFKGLPCTCCNGNYYTNMVNQFTVKDEFCTFSNLLMNGNYKFFINEFVEIFKKKKIIFVVTKYANLNKLPFDVVKEFTIGPNCLINDFKLIDEIDKYIIKNSIKNHLFLIAASSLTNVMIHKLFNKHDYNTYIDIGSSLNPYLGLDGWKNSRGYLKEYWLNEKPFIHLNKRCYF